MWAVVRGNVVGAGVLGGLTLLTHPIAGFYVLLASATLWATHGFSRRMLLAPPIALAVGAAWFGPMVLRHGLAPFVAGLGSRELDLADNLFTLMADALNPPNLAFTIGLVGVAVAAQRRRWDLLAWLAVSVFGLAVVDRWMVIPLAVLAGLAVDAALEQPARLPSVALLAVAAVTAVTGVALARPNETLGAGERELMAWAAQETPADATFAVIGYPADRGVVEWFPALSGRVNVTTWQGTEWVSTGDRRTHATAGSNCRDPVCLPEADYYILRPDCCPELVAALVKHRPGIFTKADQ
jgi:hypothetical protein